ncbi:hypothetical protein DFJ74DRAFT_652336 [Hyaloraphidium curvatum]|nr:hypothetical protein DFJ74DRAFT_652336 [Hyaloraphidium curvatum]
MPLLAAEQPLKWQCAGLPRTESFLAFRTLGLPWNRVAAGWAGSFSRTLIRLIGQSNEAECRESQIRSPGPFNEVFAETELLRSAAWALRLSERRAAEFFRRAANFQLLPRKGSREEYQIRCTLHFARFLRGDVPNGRAVPLERSWLFDGDQEVPYIVDALVLASQKTLNGDSYRSIAAGPKHFASKVRWSRVELGFRDVDPVGFASRLVDAMILNDPAVAPRELWRACHLVTAESVYPAFNDKAGDSRMTQVFAGGCPNLRARIDADPSRADYLVFAGPDTYRIWDAHLIRFLVESRGRQTRFGLLFAP